MDEISAMYLYTQQQQQQRYSIRMNVYFRMAPKHNKTLRMFAALWLSLQIRYRVFHLVHIMMEFRSWTPNDFFFRVVFWIGTFIFKLVTRVCLFVWFLIGKLILFWWIRPSNSIRCYRHRRCSVDVIIIAIYSLASTFYHLHCVYIALSVQFTFKLARINTQKPDVFVWRQWLKVNRSTMGFLIVFVFLPFILTSSTSLLFLFPFHFISTKALLPFNVASSHVLKPASRIPQL